jgi:REP element-mobilizing transposase RayT
VARDAEWFVTIACTPRGLNQLATPRFHQILVAALDHYVASGKIGVRLWVAMPDHLHLIARFSHDPGMTAVIASLKRHLARTLGIRWQRGFFDHRIRSPMELQSKAVYVRMNPVRAGLVARHEDWRFRGPC